MKRLTILMSFILLFAMLFTSCCKKSDSVMNWIKNHEPGVKNDSIKLENGHGYNF